MPAIVGDMAGLYMTARIVLGVGVVARLWVLTDTIPGPPILLPASCRASVVAGRDAPRAVTPAVARSGPSLRQSTAANDPLRPMCVVGRVVRGYILAPHAVVAGVQIARGVTAPMPVCLSGNWGGLQLHPGGRNRQVFKAGQAPTVAPPPVSNPFFNLLD